MEWERGTAEVPRAAGGPIGGTDGPHGGIFYPR
jgi:hypothetical protein